MRTTCNFDQTNWILDFATLAGSQEEIMKSSISCYLSLFTCFFFFVGWKIEEGRSFPLFIKIKIIYNAGDIKSQEEHSCFWPFVKTKAIIY